MNPFGRFRRDELEPEAKLRNANLLGGWDDHPGAVQDMIIDAYETLHERALSTDQLLGTFYHGYSTGDRILFVSFVDVLTRAPGTRVVGGTRVDKLAGVEAGLLESRGSGVSSTRELFAVIGEVMRVGEDEGVFGGGSAALYQWLAARPRFDREVAQWARRHNYREREVNRMLEILAGLPGFESHDRAWLVHEDSGVDPGELDLDASAESPADNEEVSV